jgi:hypothetical protein
MVKQNAFISAIAKINITKSNLYHKVKEYKQKLYILFKTTEYIRIFKNIYFRILQFLKLENMHAYIY